MSLSIRAPRHDEVDRLIAFIAERNRPGAQHCLFFADTEQGIRADVDKDGLELTSCFAVAEDEGGWRAAGGLVPDGDTGWLYGPWSREAADRDSASALLSQLLRDAGPRRVRAFIDQRDLELRSLLDSGGLAADRIVHVMQARRPVEVQAAQVGARIVPFDDTMLPALAAMHDEAFPGTWIDAPGLVEHARRLGRLDVALDADAMPIGYLYLSFNTLLDEADVEFVGVRADRRGRGTGRALLRHALDQAWFVAGRGVVNLCVNDVNVAALALYESLGFRRLYTGLSLSLSRSALGT